MTGGRPPGYPKTGGARKGSVKTNTKSVKAAILTVFNDDLGGVKYLRKIAKADPNLFCSLLAKLVPSEVRAEIGVSHTFDMGLMMAQAKARLEDLYPDTPMVDVTPTGDRDVCSIEATSGRTDQWREAATEAPVRKPELD